MSELAFMIDRRAVRRAFSKASTQYDQVAVLQTEVRNRLLERLDLLKLAPQVALDLGCGTGAATVSLQQRYPEAMVIAMDAALGMLQTTHARRVAARPWWQRWLPGYQASPSVCADAFKLPLKSASVDLVYSNLMLQWCDPPDGVFQELRRVLKPEGVLVFASFGPDTLRELRQAWATVDERVHVNRFVDMHDLGDAMIRAGLAEPVLDVERFTLTYTQVLELMRELKAIGAHNVNAGRAHSLTGPSALQRMTQAYETYRRDGLLPASYEVVYGQAWGREPSDANAVADPLTGEVRIPLSSIRRRR